MTEPRTVSILSLKQQRMKKIVFAFLIGLFAFTTPDKNYISFTAKPGEVRLFHKDEFGKIYGTFETLQKQLNKQGEQLIFAANGGRFLPDYSPCGLYLEKGKMIQKLNPHARSGIFYITNDNKPFIVSEKEFKDNGRIKYATQSLPKLIINKNINPALSATSTSRFIRNGVGILPSGDLLFLITTGEVSIYEFAKMFKEKKCKDALYLDGAISETYLPQKGLSSTVGYFSMIIAITEPK